MGGTASRGWPGQQAARQLPARPAALTATGCAGSVLIAGSSYWVGAVPTSFRAAGFPAAGVLISGEGWARSAYYLGLTLLCLSWLALVRGVVDGAEVDMRRLARLTLAWVAPLAVAVPIASRDAWAYVGQGAVYRVHLDPYDLGPGVLPGALNHLAAQVTAVWRFAPSPYGPLWVWLSGSAVVASGGHALLATLLLRIPILIGEVLLVVTLPALASRFRGSPGLALSLGAANPLLLVNGVGGAHNDVLMMGLVTFALYLVTSSPRGVVLLAGAAVVGIAVAVKFPAVIALPYLALVWPGRWRRRQPTFRQASLAVVPATAVALGSAGLVFGIVSGLTGLDLGWWTAATRHPSSTVALAGLVVGLVLLWGRALRRPPVPALAMSFLALALLGPTLMTWYWFWPLVIAATCLTARSAVVALAVGSLALVVQVQPDGSSAHLQLLACVALVSLVVIPVLERRGHDEDARVARQVTSGPA